MILKAGCCYEVWNAAGARTAAWSFYPSRPYDLTRALTQWPEAPSTSGWQVRVGDDVVAILGKRTIERGDAAEKYEYA